MSRPNLMPDTVGYAPRTIFHAIRRDSKPQNGTRCVPYVTELAQRVEHKHHQKTTVRPGPAEGLGITNAFKSTLFTLLLGFTVPTYAVQDTVTNYQYDAQGNLTKATSPLNTVANPVVSDYLYDALDRTSVVTQPKPAPAAAAPNIFYKYDGLDQTTQVEDPRVLATNYTLDGLGNATALASPDSGTTTNTYDADGNLKTSTDARGKTTTYSYDALGRLTKAAYPSTGLTTYTYDGGVGNTNPANVGKLTRMDDAAGTTTYSYDSLGRLTGKAQALALGTRTAWTLAVAYAYGTSGAANGKPTSITYPSGNRVNYGYDSAGRISAVTLNPANTSGVGPNTAVTTVILNNIQYSPTGRFYSGAWGNHTPTAWSGIVHTDDQDGRAVAYHLGNPSKGGTLRSVQYDPAGRATAYTHTGTGIGAFAPANSNQGFTYDNLGRLKAYTSALGNQAYDYDASGNRTATGSFSHTIAANSNRLLATQGPAPAKANTYDATGNLLGDGTYGYTYTDHNRINSVTNIATGFANNYRYNGLGQRIRKYSANSFAQYAYDEQGRLLGEYDAWGFPLQETVYLGDRPIAVLTQAVSLGAATAAVDNTAAAGTPAANWPVTTDATAQGGSHQVHAALPAGTTSTDSFTWNLSLPGPGKYWLQARWRADPARASNAVYTISAADGTSVAGFDQRGNNNAWVNLVLHAVSAGNPNVTVKLAASNLGTVSADAVRAVPAQVATNLHYVYTDHINTPRVITRATDNQMVWRWDQADPFGAVQPNENPAGLGNFKYNPRFPGQLYDAETGLYYNYFRHYDPRTGTYTQSDPIGLGGGVNTYAYVSGNPVNLIDPLGLSPGTDGAPSRGIGDFFDKILPPYGATSLPPGGTRTQPVNDPAPTIDWPNGKSGKYVCTCRAQCRSDCLKPGEDTQYGSGIASGDDLQKTKRAAQDAAENLISCQGKHTTCKCVDKKGDPIRGLF